MQGFLSSLSKFRFCLMLAELSAFVYGYKEMGMITESCAHVASTLIVDLAVHTPITQT